MDLAVAALAAFRLTRLAILDDFPPVQAARDSVIARFGKHSLIGEILDCPWCAGFWLSGAVALAVYRWPATRKFALVPALSAAVGLLSTLDSYLGAEPVEAIDAFVPGRTVRLPS